MKRNFIILIFLGISFQLSFAQAGKTGLSFLKLGLGSRALSMGEAYSTIGTEPFAMNYNPATLTQSQSVQVVFSHREWVQDTKSDFLGVSTVLDNFVLGFGVQSLSVSNIEIRSVPGPLEGTFDAKNASLGVTTAYKFSDELSIGLTANYLYEKIYVDEATGYGLNIGATYLTPWDVRLGLSYANLGSMSELNRTATTLPATIRFGGAYEIPLKSVDGNFITAAEIISVKNEGTAHVHLGVEFDFQQMFALRGGFQSGYESKNITTGVGFKYEMFKLDYAFVPVKLDFGSSHTFTIGVVF
ncbi:MAG: PorV/PorQ family protein [Ignavibacteriae bacterium]|nr:PorV/PorQ family protein [Ignavibacteriota bacterium]